MRINLIKRKCNVCGKKLKIKIDKNGHYTGGHYFGALCDFTLSRHSIYECLTEYWECENDYYNKQKFSNNKHE